MGGRDPKSPRVSWTKYKNFKRDYDNLNALGIALQIMNASDLVASIDTTALALDANSGIWQLTKRSRIWISWVKIS